MAETATSSSGEQPLVTAQQQQIILQQEGQPDIAFSIPLPTTTASAVQQPGNLPFITPPPQQWLVYASGAPMMPPVLDPIQVSYRRDPIHTIICGWVRGGAYVEPRTFRRAVLRAALPLSSEADIRRLPDGEAEVAGYTEWAA